MHFAMYSAARAWSLLAPVTWLLVGGAAAAGDMLPGPSSPTAAQIVAAADAIRNPGGAFRLTNTLVEYRDGEEIDRMVLQVYARNDQREGVYRNILRFLEPHEDRDKLVLQDDAQMWFYDPNSGASVRLSPRQRLIGQAANGDALTANLAMDYSAIIEGQGTILKADREECVCWHLTLTAVDPSVTYARADYWVEVDSYRPIKGKYYVDSGRLLKTLYYADYRDWLGAFRPSTVLIIDGIDPRLVTRMSYSQAELRDIPASWFSRAYLPRFRGD